MEVKQGDDVEIRLSYCNLSSNLCQGILVAIHKVQFPQCAVLRSQTINYICSLHFTMESGRDKKSHSQVGRNLSSSS